jgi:hypothetical protein
MGEDQELSACHAKDMVDLNTIVFVYFLTETRVKETILVHALRLDHSKVKEIGPKSREPS